MEKQGIIYEILKNEGLTVTELAKILATSTAQISGLKNRTLSKNFAARVKNAFPKYNLIWLLTGEGEPFDGAAVAPAAAPAVPASTAADGEQYKALFAELVAQRKMFEGQISRLLELLEILSKKNSGETTAE